MSSPSFPPSDRVSPSLLYSLAAAVKASTTKTPFRVEFSIDFRIAAHCRRPLLARPRPRAPGPGRLESG